MKFVIAIAAFIALAVPTTAQALTFQSTDGTMHPQPYQSWVDQSKIQFSIAQPVTLDLDADGVSAASPGTIWLTSFGENRLTLLHETGHQFDYFIMKDWARDRFRQILSINRLWRSPGGNSPHEQFAEAFKFCALHTLGPARYWPMGEFAPPTSFGYNYLPTRKQYNKVCRLISYVARAA